MHLKSVTVVKRRGRWTVDYYDELKKRRRTSFASKAEAIAYKQLVVSGQAISPAQATEAVTIKAAIEKYAQLCGTAKGQYTWRQEKAFLREFYDFVYDREKLDQIDQVRLVHLESFKRFLNQEKRNGPATVNRKLTPIAHMFGKLKKWGVIQLDPSDELEKLKDPDATTIKRELWTDKEIDCVLAELSETSRAALFAESHLGCRPFEVRRLRWGEVDFQRQLVKVSSAKGDGVVRHRLIPMMPELLEALVEWRNQRSASLAMPHLFVFPGTNGVEMGRCTLSQAVRRARKRLGIEKKLVPVGLRHSLLSRLVQLNQNLEKVRMLAGHTQLRTTQKYLHLVQGEDLRDAMLVAAESRRNKQH